MEENAENTATTPPVSETIQENAGNSEHSEPTIAPAETAEAEPKRRGRPAGAKDKQPRKQKPTVVEVDATPPPASQAAQSSEPSSAPVPPAQPSELTPGPVQPSEPAQPSEPDPMTPRRMYRETATHLAHLKTLINSQKRQALGEMYTRKLMTLVQ
jgi:hypothetical protein